jgi:hypothetical protein
MNTGQCVFCDELLDDSDEHIIPACLNGRLRSKNIVCHKCNTVKFGLRLDPVVKKLVNTTLLVLGLENGNAIHSEDPGGTKYLFGKKGKVFHIKPELRKIKLDGKTLISVSGNRKKAIELYAKQVAEFIKQGYTPLRSDIRVVQELHLRFALIVNLK